MNIAIEIFIIYILIINIISVTVTVVDKYCAIKHKWRVKENTLMLFAALGGSVGMFVAMQIIRHKTRRIKFMLGIPVMLILQCILIYFLWRTIYG